MKIKIYIDKEKTKTIYDMPLSDYLIIVNNELFKEHWQVIEYGDVVITKGEAECQEQKEFGQMD
jgi:hypothetical protein